MRPGEYVVNRDDGLLAEVMESIVLGERREQTRRVHHPTAGKLRYSVLPGELQFAARESTLEQVAYSGQEGLKPLVLRWRHR